MIEIPDQEIETMRISSTETHLAVKVKVDHPEDRPYISIYQIDD